MSRGHGKVQRFILGELAGTSPAEYRLTANLVYGWHKQRCPGSLEPGPEYPGGPVAEHRGWCWCETMSRAEQESVWRAVRTLAAQGLVGIGYIHEYSMTGDLVPGRAAPWNQLLQAVYLRPAGRR